jgi:hypothetical protein
MRSSFFSLHICVTLPMAKSGVAEKFLKDVRECSNKILRNPDWQTTGAVSYFHILNQQFCWEKIKSS